MKTAERRPVAWVLAIGNELLNGAIADKNTSAICRFLEERGLAAGRALLLPDVDAEIRAGLESAAAAADLVFTTGGLGPTSDDRTRFVIAEATGSPLAEHAGARKKLEALFASRKRPMSENNLRQVLFPEGAEVLVNSEGTADAFVSYAVGQLGQRVPVVSLPGIPRELNHLLAEQVSPWLEKHFPARAPVTRRFLRCFGRSESYLGERIEALALPAGIEVAYRPMFPEILLTFSVSGSGHHALLDDAIPRVRDAVGREFVFSDSSSSSMREVLFSLLLNRGLTLAAAESCTGGMLADAFVSLPGASAVFLGGVVSYHNRMKENLLGVSAESLMRYGAVSAEVAREMAHGARLRAQADIGISVTGVAGPDGGTKEKPVGTVHFGLSTRDGEDAVQQFYAVERNMFRAFCTTAALDLIRRKLNDLPLEWQRR